MGSYDKVPDGWYEFGDAIWAPRHVIFCRSGWSGAEEGRHEHESAAEVKACFEAARDEAKGIQVWPCGWLMLGHYDDGSTFTYPCTAPARATDEFGSHACAFGHDHVSAQVRYAQGWDYASDPGEAKLLREHGIDAVAMNGGSI